ncbi:MAG TPA: hypothetical protein VGC13_18930 [Longimicrobium sp.]|jgi:hypothetical protein|uniref:hypothetical protein n=1 Tax=Longimicrobium sp. TaxID=2029185 RepID=UPI002EDA1BAB
MKISALLAPALCLALAGCDNSALSVVCPDDPQPSVVVGVFDFEGTAMAHETRGWYTVAGVTDSLRHATVGGVQQLAAYGPPGVYDVRVERPGQPDWSVTGLQVEDTECGPATRRINLQVQAASVN